MCPSSVHSVKETSQSRVGLHPVRASQDASRKIFDGRVFRFQLRRAGHIESCASFMPNPVPTFPAYFISPFSL